MLSYATIQEQSKKAAHKAQRSNKKPASIKAYNGEVVEFCKKIPFLGDYIPEGWELSREIAPLFVDSSGFGEEGEAALTLRQFGKKLDNFKLSRDNYGFGILEAGQFQVLIGVYRPHRKDFTRTGELTKDDLSKL